MSSVYCGDGQKDTPCQTPPSGRRDKHIEIAYNVGDVDLPLTTESAEVPELEHTFKAYKRSGYLFALRQLGPKHSVSKITRSQCAIESVMNKAHAGTTFHAGIENGEVASSKHLCSQI